MERVASFKLTREEQGRLFSEALNLPIFGLAEVTRLTMIGKKREILPNDRFPVSQSRQTNEGRTEGRSRAERERRDMEPRRGEVRLLFALG